MTKRAVECDLSSNELHFVYRPRDDTSSVREKCERGEELVVKGTFHLTSRISWTTLVRTYCAAMSKRVSAPWSANTPNRKWTPKRCNAYVDKHPTATASHLESGVRQDQFLMSSDIQH